MTQVHIVAGSCVIVVVVVAAGAGAGAGAAAGAAVLSIWIRSEISTRKGRGRACLGALHSGTSAENKLIYLRRFEKPEKRTSYANTKLSSRIECRQLTAKWSLDNELLGGLA